MLKRAAALILGMIISPALAQEVAGSGSPRLTLTAKEWAAQVGDSVLFELRLKLPGFEALADSRIEGRLWSGLPEAPGEHSSGAGPKFVRDILLEPQVEGNRQVGPLELELGGRKI